MKKEKRDSIPSLSPGASDEEIIHWVDTYDVVERLKAGVSEIVEDHSDLDAWLKEALEKGNGAQLNIQIPPAMKAILTRFARERMMDVTTLARVWLVDRIREELNKGSAARPRQDAS